MAERVYIAAAPRTVLGKKVKQLRRQGRLPGNVYGRGIPSVAIDVDHREFMRTLKTSGIRGMFELTIDGEGKAKVLEHRRQALAAGARLVAGGGERDGRLVSAALLADVPADALLAREETFGPLAGVIAFDSVEEAIRLANDTPFGLAAYFCSQDPQTIARVGRGLESGIVGVNTGLISTPYAPFGGVKLSGIGREGSHHGIEEYLSVKYLCEANL